eukprot:IDg1660t1
MLAISPMAADEKFIDGNAFNEATKFNAESYIQFLRDTFQVYGWTFDEWCIALI